VSVSHFQRIGTFLEVHDWQQYTEMLSQWARSIDTFETTVKRISELRELVYFEIEERDVPESTGPRRELDDGVRVRQ
jgi:hypothetical protein